MDTVEDKIFIIDLSYAKNIRPYQFEPLANTSKTPRSATSDNDSSNVKTLGIDKWILDGLLAWFPSVLIHIEYYNLATKIDHHPSPPALLEVAPPRCVLFLKTILWK